MKKQITTFFAGMLTTAIITSLGVTAFAAVGGSVSFNSVNLSLDGKQISAKGENYTIGSGTSVPASILYTDENGGGTTYLPIARVSELLGAKIGWDGKSGSVLLGEGSGETADDLVNVNDDKKLSYQEFKDMWKIEPYKSGDGIKQPDGKWDGTPWVSYIAVFNNEIQDEGVIRKQIEEAESVGHIRTLGKELCDDERNLSIGFTFDSGAVWIHAR